MFFRCYFFTYVFRLFISSIFKIVIKTMKELPKPNMDIFEVESTIKFIAECKSNGVQCKELEDYIKPLVNSKRVNLYYEQREELSIKQS